MPAVFFMIGLPGAGKSKIAKEHLDRWGGVILSSDNIRKTLYGDESIQGDPKEVFSHLHSQLERFLDKGFDVILDSTNISYKHRRQVLQKLTKLDVEQVAVLIATPYHEVLENNESRERVVPERIISRMRKNFFAPFWGEGWDDIEIVWNTRMSSGEIADRYSLKDLFYMMDGFEQDNPHHEHTLGKHIRMVRDDVYTLSDDVLLRAAGGLHDVGKIWTKQFKNIKGDETDIAHYYSHESVGAYMSLYYLKAEGWSDNDIIDIVTLIQFHMRPYGAKTEKAKQKLRNLVGDDVYEKLILLNRADIGAH